MLHISFTYMSVCEVNTDIIFVIDSSGSIGESDYRNVLDAVNNYVAELKIGREDNQVGLIIFSDDAMIIFNLNTYTDKSELQQAINNTQYIGSRTDTAAGLQQLIDVGYTVEAGARLKSQTVLRVAIVLTDGRSNDKSETFAAAKRVHDFTPAILVYAVGVGDNVDQTELEAIATDKAFIESIADFDPSNLRRSQDERTYQICFIGKASPITNNWHKLYL